MFARSTVLQAGPCVVTQHKTADARRIRGGADWAGRVCEGIEADQADARALCEEQSSAGEVHARSCRSRSNAPGETTEGVIKPGDRVLVDIFEGERFVDVIGVSKGHGFQGVVKRHHFGGGPKSHGSMFQITGSIGSSAFPSRVFKGMRMSGHMGDSA